MSAMSPTASAPASVLAQPVVVEMRKLWTVFQVAGREVVVHKDLDLIIERGEMLSLVGGSGSG